jgi:hypothetical protein
MSTPLSGMQLLDDSVDASADEEDDEDTEDAISSSSSIKEADKRERENGKME